MQLFHLTPLSVTVGMAAVLIAAIIRFHYPFRYQYLAYLFRKHPDTVKRLLNRSYKKNHAIVGLLDKSTKEILECNYTTAQKYIISGLQLTKKSRTARNQLIAVFFYYNLSWSLYYQNQYEHSLQIALQVYEKNPLPDILALISCNFARTGDIQRAVEAETELGKMKKVHSVIQLICRAEIEAAKGNTEYAIQLLNEVKRKQFYTCTYYIPQEIDNRIVQLKKTA